MSFGPSGVGGVNAMTTSAGGGGGDLFGVNLGPCGSDPALSLTCGSPWGPEGEPAEEDEVADDAGGAEGDADAGDCTSCEALTPLESEHLCEDASMVCLSGADLYDLSQIEGCRTVQDFNVHEGDRFVGFDDWSTDDSLRAANGETIFVERADCDPNDLIITFMLNGGEAVVRLDDFFVINPEFDGVSASDALSDFEAVPILRMVMRGLLRRGKWRASVIRSFHLTEWAQ